MPINKPWLRYAELRPRDLPGTVGVYELGTEEGETLYIGYAGGRSLFGLRGEIGAHFSDGELNPALQGRLSLVRYEVTTNYLVRHVELLSRYREDAGRLPAGNEASREPLPPLARFHWPSAHPPAEGRGAQ